MSIRRMAIVPGMVFMFAGLAVTPATGTALEDLASKAKGSDHKVTLSLEAMAPEVIRAKEEAFEKRFGFPLRLQSEPGHHRKAPTKVIQAAKNGKGVIDMWAGGLPLVLKMFREGYTRTPPWEAVFAGWPKARELRAAVPKIKGPGGIVLGDHCMHYQMGSWAIVYNTRKVKPAELKGIKLEDLTTDKWHNRVVWDARALGLYVLPFAPGWDENKMRVFAHNLGANGVKLVSGGSSGVIQSLIQGEGDVGLASMNWVVQQKALGAPLEIAFPEFVLGNFTVTCLIKPGVNDPHMASLFWAWDTFDGSYTEAKINGGGVFRLNEDESAYLPLVKLARANGITKASQVVGPKTGTEAKRAGKYRKTAIKALKEGIASKKKIME